MPRALFPILALTQFHAGPEIVGLLFAAPAVGAFVAYLLLLGDISADLKDKRPDWPAFILIILAPAFMSVVGGPIGTIFDLLLWPGAWVSGNFATLIGA